MCWSFVKVTGFISATPTVTAERIASVARAHRCRVEYLIALDAGPPWSTKLNRSVPIIFVAKDPINLYVLRHPIKIKPETAIF